ncbi:VPLPA-CTERM sorting domain-containing protein [Puniceibacterium sediminis]|uniref:VPLPA-CTERM protein sorting domain-containing protein n=1 Tax=Puniceibacterium sediminis TaxID=1608407 RepID=A0A238ZYR4_9RHOB|nr:VPLPA-CTERM sorting domain-containing protein [Puniceibacterium sediminis]SNR88525.1 VPLPA-CTERM protein sorting domain-containing protein [Puniceibacterium sediminis]
MFSIKKIPAILTVFIMSVISGQAVQAATTTPFIFTWSSVPYSHSEVFTIGANEVGSLSLLSYSGVGPTEASGFIFLNGSTRLTTDTTACNGAGGVFFGGCNIIQSTTPDGTILFSGLGAGTYTLGVYERRIPSSGTLAFNLDATVPLPAAGLLLLGAIGGAAALRKRRKAA